MPIEIYDRITMEGTLNRHTTEFQVDEEPVSFALRHFIGKKVKITIEIQEKKEENGK